VHDCHTMRTEPGPSDPLERRFAAEWKMAVVLVGVLSFGAGLALAAEHVVTYAAWAAVLIVFLALAVHLKRLQRQLQEREGC
jgi:Flp pilus assembly protein TadB